MSLEDLSEQSDLVLWKLLGNKNARRSTNNDQTDSDDDTDGMINLQKENWGSIPRLSPFPVDGLKISPTEIVNISLVESHIPASFNLELNWKAFTLPKDLSTGETIVIGKENFP